MLCYNIASIRKNMTNRIVKKEKLTPLRERVLGMLRQNKKPMKAYDILKRLHAKPPTVYRTLDYLIQSGRIHKIESSNAFVICKHPNKPHYPQFAVCSECGVTEELNQPELSQAIQQWSRKTKTSIIPHSLEITGVCKGCISLQDSLI